MLRPFPQTALREVLTLKGNEKCCDCPSVDASWASVNHGILLCLECAGKHRSLGVQNSFIRSIYMDTWSQDQVDMMLQGGNRQLQEYFEKLKIEVASLSVEKLYQTRASAHYREKLRERVCFLALDKSLSGIGNSPGPARRRSRSRTDNCNTSTRIVSGTFAEGPLGMTLSQGVDGGAYVSYIVRHGCAERCGIVENDVVISISGRSMTNYEDIMDSIPFAQRPMRIEFSRMIYENFNEGVSSALNRQFSWQPLSMDDSSFCKLTESMSITDGGDVNRKTETKTEKTLHDQSAKVVGSIVADPSPAKPTTLDFNDVQDDRMTSSGIDDIGNGISDSNSNTNNYSNSNDNRGSTSNNSNNSNNSVGNELYGVEDELNDWLNDPAETFDRTSKVNVTFPSSPLGLTLTMNELGSAEISKINPGGNADRLEVQVGDVIILINGKKIDGYDEAMRHIKSAAFPLEICFRRVLMTSPSPVDESLIKLV